MSHDLDAVLAEFDVSWLLASGSGDSETLLSNLPRCYSVPVALFTHETEPDLESGCTDLEMSASEPLPHQNLVSQASPTTKSLAYESSLKVFLRHVKTTVMSDGSVKVDASGIVSRACYEDWLSTRPHAIHAPEKTFQRIITCSVSGTDGRRPFSPLEEASVLEQLRMKRVWPAFVGSSFVIGSKGFRSYVSLRRRALTPSARQGYHEKARLGGGDVSAAASPYKRAKIIAIDDDVKHVTTCGDDDAPCFDWREATREPTADDLTAALREFEARHASRAALAFSVFSVDAAPAQNAVRPSQWVGRCATDCPV